MQTLFRKLRQKVNEIDDVDILAMESKMSQKNLFPFSSDGATPRWHCGDRRLVVDRCHNAIVRVTLI